MSDLLVILTAPLTVGALPLQTIAEWLTTQLDQFKTLLVAFAAVVVLALSVARMIKSGFSLASVIQVGLVAALAVWLFAGGGIETLSALVGEQAKAK